MLRKLFILDLSPASWNTLKDIYAWVSLVVNWGGVSDTKTKLFIVNSVVSNETLNRRICLECAKCGSG